MTTSVIEPAMAGSALIFCSTCGDRMAATATACPKCGAPNGMAKGKTSEKTWIAALLLCFFLGVFGFHRFYVGKVGTGILQLITLGGLGIWAFIDFILIVVDNFKDANGLPLKR
ncbi:NINE protein [Novispirillum sp. DQ9]|uniref:TM2 domain-containing protein n=1 Tax=Novispirillum sp. DQ9 TaxID=3398612 RepID=UPI003C7CE949